MNMQLTLDDLQPQDTGSDHGIPPETINDIFEQYNHLVQNGRQFSNAVLGHLNLLLESYPSNAALLMRRSYFYNTRSMQTEELADLTLILNSNPEHKQALFNRTQIYFEMKHYDDALIDLNQLLSNHSFVSNNDDKTDYFQALHDRASIRMANHDYDLALRDINTLLNDNEYVSNDHYKLGYLKTLLIRVDIYEAQGKDDNDQLPDLNQALSGDNEPFLYNQSREHWKIALCNRIQINLEQNNLDEALIDLNLAIKKNYIHERLTNDETVDFRYQRSLIHQSRNDTALELSDLDSVLKDTPDHIEALKRRQVIHARASNIRQATLDEHALVEATLAQNVQPAPSLFSLCKMAFFKYEPTIYTSGVVFTNPERMREVLYVADINPISLATMRQKLNGVTIQTTTIFDQLDRIDTEIALRRMQQNAAPIIKSSETQTTPMANPLPCAKRAREERDNAEDENLQTKFLKSPGL